MTTIMVLIRHNHYLPVSQTLDILVFLLKLQADYLNKTLDFLIVQNLFLVRLSHIQEFPFQRETTELAPPHHLDSSHCQRFS